MIFFLITVRLCYVIYRCITVIWMLLQKCFESHCYYIVICTCLYNVLWHIIWLLRKRVIHVAHKNGCGLVLKAFGEQLSTLISHSSLWSWGCSAPCRRCSVSQNQLFCQVQCACYLHWCLALKDERVLLLSSPLFLCRWRGDGVRSTEEMGPELYVVQKSYSGDASPQCLFLYLNWGSAL